MFCLQMLLAKFVANGSNGLWGVGKSKFIIFSQSLSGSWGSSHLGSMSFRHTNVQSLVPSPLETSIISTPQISPPWSAPYPSPPLASSPADLVTHYNDCLSSALKIMAPLKTHLVSFILTAPWFTLDLHQLKATGHWPEHLYKRKTDSLYTVKCIWTTFNTTKMPLLLPNLHTTTTSSTLGWWKK